VLVRGVSHSLERHVVSEGMSTLRFRQLKTISYEI